MHNTEMPKYTDCLTRSEIRHRPLYNQVKIGGLLHFDQ